MSNVEYTKRQDETTNGAYSKVKASYEAVKKCKEWEKDF